MNSTLAIETFILRSEGLLLCKKMKKGIPMAGRKSKPTAVKKLEGNLGKRKLNKKEPVPAKRMPDYPDWLLPEAKVEWERLCEKLSLMGFFPK